MGSNGCVGVLSVLGWLALLGVGPAACGQKAAQLAKYQEQLIQLLKDQAAKGSVVGLDIDLIARSHGRFLLDGVVVDEQGKPLRGVRLTYPKSASLEELARAEIDYLKTGHPSLGYEPQTDIIQGSFHVDITGFRGCLNRGG